MESDFETFLTVPNYRPAAVNRVLSTESMPVQSKEWNIWCQVSMGSDLCQ